jgi:hypothetical protein
MFFDKIGDFDTNAGNCGLYVERLEMYFKVNKEKGLWFLTLITNVIDGVIQEKGLNVNNYE